MIKDPAIPSFSPHEISDDELSQAVGQLLVVGFEGDAEEAPEPIQRSLREGTIGGVILFRRNISGVEQVVSLVESVHAASQESGAGRLGLAPWVAVDQEGGRVVRLREPLTQIPPMGVVGKRCRPDQIASLSEVMATELAALGFNLNFAPVLDVNTNPENPVIGDRAFSSDAWEVAQAGGAFLLGHVMSGVVPCGKHFPGHGDTLQDSHKVLPVVGHDEDRLKRIELVPFMKAVEASYPMLMTAHVLVPALDRQYPATLSHAIIKGLLRDRMGYQGVVVSDCLEMKALADGYEIEEMVELAIRAGVDMFLICHTELKWRRAHAHLVELARQNELDRFRVVTAANRIAKLKRVMLGTIPMPWKRSEDWQHVLGCAEHRERILTMLGGELGDTIRGSEKDGAGEGVLDPTEE